MNVSALLLFVPLGIGITWLFYLVFKANLATQPLGKIVSYFIGVVIIVLVVGWFIDYLVPQWVNQRLLNTASSSEWRQFIDNSQRIVEDSFSPSANSGNLVVISTPTPATILILPSPTPHNLADEMPLGEGQQRGPQEYIVVSGDTLSAIGRQFGVGVPDLKSVNGLSNDIIYPGQKLAIPARTTPTP